MYFLADDILENVATDSPFVNCPKYKIVMDMDKNLVFPFKDYFLPHEKFWVESTFGSNGVQRNSGFYIEESEDRESFMAAWYMETDDNRSRKIFGIEVTPINVDGNLKAKVYTSDENIKMLEDGGMKLESLLSYVTQLIYELNRRDAVKASIKGRKVNVSGNKKNRKKLDYSIVTRKKYVSNAINLLGRKIDFTFAFPVRGHWRELPGKTGKDRRGNYCVTNKTWVTESIKGSGELITKRIVK